MTKAVGYRILIEPHSLEETDQAFKTAKAAGIVIPDHEDINRKRQAVSQGKVLQVGPEAYTQYKEPWCKVGDLVLFAKYAGATHQRNGKTYFFLNDEDIIGVLDD